MDPIASIIKGETSEQEALDYIENEMAPRLCRMLASRVPAYDFEATYGFAKEVLHLCVHWLSMPKPLPSIIAEQLKTLFLLNKHCSYFFTMRETGIYGDARDAPKYSGPLVKFPPSGACKYFVGMMTYFCSIDGYKIVCRRIQGSAGF